MDKVLRMSLASITLFSIGFAMLSPVAAMAQPISATPPVDPLSPKDNTIDDVNDVKLILEKITNWMFTIFIALAAVMIIYAAFIYLTSGGGEDVSKAHKMLLYSAVAIAVATASRGLVNLTRNFVEK